jgi:hypothetical protein
MRHIRIILSEPQAEDFQTVKRLLPESLVNTAAALHKAAAGYNRYIIKELSFINWQPHDRRTPSWSLQVSVDEELIHRDYKRANPEPFKTWLADICGGELSQEADSPGGHMYEFTYPDEAKPGAGDTYIISLSDWQQKMIDAARGDYRAADYILTTSLTQAERDASSPPATPASNAAQADGSDQPAISPAADGEIGMDEGAIIAPQPGLIVAD